jgi:hypothetical protein
MYKHIIAVAGLATALAMANSALAAEKTMNLARKAKSGVDSGLAYAGRWDRNCNGQPVTVSITRQPANGTVSVIDADETLPASTPASGGTGQCAGKTITSKKIIYRSAPGFRGSDTVGYESEGGGTIIHTTIAVTVR